MSLGSAAARVRAVLRKPPSYVVARALTEAQRELDRWLAPRRERRFDRDRLLSLARASSVDALWTRLSERPFPVATVAMNAAALDRLAPGESVRVLAAAERACQRF